MPRECFYVPEDMSALLEGICLKKVARITYEVTRHLQSLSALTVQGYHSPVPPGVSTKPAPMHLPFSTFVGALLAVIDYGMDDAPVRCRNRVCELREGLMAVEGRLRRYLQYHRITLEPFPEQVRDALIVAINEAFDEATLTLAVESEEIWRRHQLMPPPPGSGPEFKPPEFLQLSMLLEGGGTNSLAERSVLWGGAPAKTTGPGAEKRNAVPGVEHETGNGHKGRARLRRGGIPFRFRLATWGNPPPNACGYTWSGGSCPRIVCRFAHDQGSLTLRSKTPAVAGNKTPPPPTPSPTAAETTGARQRGHRRGRWRREPAGKCHPFQQEPRWRRARSALPGLRRGQGEGRQ